ncbi:glycosyl hydrolase family 95 catalytic domain-containing protein [Ulvibacterium sp.]|uniref:glycosyl hydrolase family 95 catalytic domain-containing protein n=1 Tax=Ulvibacterium sp. TaxID=2665914 RepID=UPI003BAD90F6
MMNTFSKMIGQNCEFYTSLKNRVLFAWILLFFSCDATYEIEPTANPNDLHFNALSKVWDEAIPLGNGIVGSLVWEKEGKLRFSLDRADLWDLRPMQNRDAPEWKFSWVVDQWKKGDYKPVQEMFDVPYDKDPAPSKIPGAAIEFDIAALGEVASVHLYIKEAICEVKWKNGVRLLTFVHATEPVGWYRFEGLENALEYELVPPAYAIEGQNGTEDPVTGLDLRRLGYSQGSVTKNNTTTTYHQKGWGGFEYQVSVTGAMDNGVFQGSWNISSAFPEEELPSSKEIADTYFVPGWEASFNSHKQWWANFWSKSSIHVPDTILQKQWYLEQYKFGATARAGAPPISLQSVWTADNGRLPPWKGDFHHDLNTQLSYWPAYSGNHLDLEIGYTDWLWKYRDEFKRYTKNYYGTDGLNVPGVTTLTGQPMGGWIQYAFGPTVSSWLGQHFYLHWRYSMDRDFLEERAYPWIKDVALFLEGISEIDSQGFRKLPLSSSPEINDNRKDAWFAETTNYDLAFIRWTYEKAAELAKELKKQEEADRWKKLLAQWPEFTVDASGLWFAPEKPYDESHRHFSNQVGYHPLGVLDFSKGEKDRKIIENTIKTIDSIGSSAWVGYSFSWLANMKARAFDGQGAAKALKIFATSFCLPNSFHVNGDQSGKGYSDYTYRPFTLEGNFAFAAGLQEMLIQSHTPTIVVFPAIPDDWKELRFTQLRTEGAFLVSAERKDGKTTYVQVQSTEGGNLKLKNPFDSDAFECSHEYTMDKGGIIAIETNPGDVIELKMNQ